MDTTGTDVTTGIGAGPSPSQVPPGGSSADTMTVSRGAFADYNGDYHAAVADAKRARENREYLETLDRFKKAGYTREQFEQLVDYYVQSPGGNGGGNQSGLTAEEVQRLLDQRNEKLLSEIGTRFQGALQERDQTVEATMKRQTMLEQARKAKEDFGIKTVEELGHKVFDEDGKVNPAGMMYYREFLNALYQVQAESAKDIPEDQQEDYFAMPTEAQLKAARERAQWLKDYRFEAAASVAREQESIPGATLGAGPGGKEQKPDFESMTPEQQRAAVMQGIPIPSSPDL